MAEIKNIAIIGSGTMGGGIAISALSGGITTVLIDTSDDALARAKARVIKFFDRQVVKERMTAEEAKKRCLVFTLQLNFLPQVRLIS